MNRLTHTDVYTYLAGNTNITSKAKVFSIKPDDKIIEESFSDSAFLFLSIVSNNKTVNNMD